MKKAFVERKQTAGRFKEADNWKHEFQQILIRELARRRERNPAYSARAFAQSLGLSNGAISEILSGQRKLSLNATLELVPKLKLPNIELRRLLGILGEPAPRKKFKGWAVADSSRFDWVNKCILSIFDSRLAPVDEAWLLSYLGISLEEFENRKKFLCEVGLLQQSAEGQLISLLSQFSEASLVPAANRSEWLDKHLTALITRDRTQDHELPSKVAIIPLTENVMRCVEIEFSRAIEAIEASVFRESQDSLKTEVPLGSLSFQFIPIRSKEGT